MSETQFHVVRRMARDFDIPITIVACPTVREPDGLALSSRNVRFSPAQRQVAPQLAAALFGAADAIASGAPVASIIDAARSAVAASG